MKYRRSFLKTLAILAPVALVLSSCATEPSNAYAYNWCSSSYDPNCAYPYAYPYAYGDFFFGSDRDRFDHHFHGGFNHGGFGHGGVSHGGGGHGGGGHGR